MYKKELFVLSNIEQTDPALNLAIEEYAIRQLPPENDYIFLYTNTPAVIIGKHQNVAEEVNLPFCAHHRIPVLRRISGGGAVYHDSGCLNFSFISAHTLKNFNVYTKFLNPILEILTTLNLKAETDMHNNLLLFGKKISGNAQFTSAGRLLSHGTLLFNADLEYLKESLKTNSAIHFESRSTKSRRTVVTNLCLHSDSDRCNIPFFRQELLKYLFGNELREFVLSAQDLTAIHRLADEKYRHWEWNFGRSPDSILRKSVRINGRTIRLMLRLKKGRIEQAQIEGEAAFSTFASALRGQKYEFLSLNAFLSVWPGSLPASLEGMLNLLF